MIINQFEDGPHKRKLVTALQIVIKYVFVPSLSKVTWCDMSSKIFSLFGCTNVYIFYYHYDIFDLFLEHGIFTAYFCK